VTGAEYNMERTTCAQLWRAFDFQSLDDLTLNNCLAKVECCKQLMRCGVGVLPASAQDDRSCICIAATMGYFDVLLTLLQSIPNEDLAMDMPCFKYLIWNVLMSCAHWSDFILKIPQTGHQIHRSGNIRDPRPQCLCLEILLEYAFPGTGHKTTH
jgi:hypothetical protein